MLRLIFVFIIIFIGSFYAAQSALYALLFYLWNAYFRPEEWTYGGLIQSLHLSFIIGLYLVIRTAFSFPRLQLNLRTALVLLFLMQSALGTLQSEHPLMSWYYLQDFMKVLLVSYFIVVLLDDRKKFRLALVVMALALGFECAKQGWVSQFRSPGSRNDNPIAFLGDNNGVALGTMMLVPILGALAQTATSQWEKRLMQFVGVGVFLRGLTTYSRGGFLAAGVLAVFMVVRAEKKFRAALGVLAVVGLVWYLMPQYDWDRMSTINVSDEQRDDSAAGRLHFWLVAVDMAHAKPLFGVGLNGFGSLYERYNLNEKFGGVRATHSSWFGVLADLGYPGFILFVSNITLAFWSCWRVHRLTRKDPARRELRIYANALIASLAAFVVAGSFLSQQYSEMMWHFIGLSTALYLITIEEMQAAEAPAAVKLAPAPIGPGIRRG